jgi:hypothetical protein
MCYEDPGLSVIDIKTDHWKGFHQAFKYRRDNSSYSERKRDTLYDRFGVA